MPDLTVTVGGLPGTGSTSLCRILERRLDLPYVYAGQVFRQEAVARGLTLEELNELAQHDERVDRALDERQLAYLRGGGVILEGRLSGWLARRNGIEAFTVWVTCDPDERVRRLVDRDGGDPQTQAQRMRERVERERDRYRRYYGADFEDLSLYDLVLDSTATPPPDLADRVEAALDEWRSVRDPEA